MKAIWPEAEKDENHWFSLFFGALAALGGVLERLGGFLKTSWSRLGAAAAVATPDAAVCVGVPAALGRSCTAPGPLVGALGPSRTFLGFSSL